MNDSVPPPGFVPPPSGGEPVPVHQPTPGPARRSPRFSRRSLVVAAVGLAAAVIAVFLALGSSSNPTVDPIAEAATVSSHAPGYRMHMSLSLTSSAFGGAITGYGDAVVDPRDHAVSTSFSIDLSSIPQVAQVLGDATISMNLVEDGHTVYVKLPQMLLGKIPGLANKPWLELNVSKMSGIPGLSSFGADPTTTDPAQMLQYLRAASDRVTNEGQQQVGGVQTTHYHAQLSLDRLTAGIPAAEQPAVQQALSKLRQALGSSDLPVDVWVDAHQLVRRTAMSISVHPAGGATLQETVVADVTDYGPQPRPAVPPADQVQNATSLLSAGGVAG